MKAIGRLFNIGISKETTRGTQIASPTFYVPKRSFSHFDRVIKARSELSYNNIISEGNINPIALRWAEGSFDTDVLSKSFGLFLLALLGTVSTTGPSDSAYTHTFTLQNDNQHDSLSLWVDDPLTGDIVFTLAMINTLTMEFVPDDVVKVSIDFMSKASKGVSNLSPSYSAESKFLGRHLTFKIENATGDLNAGSNVPIKSLTLRFNKNVIKDDVLGTIDPEDILNQQLGIEGEVVLNLENRVYKDLMLSGSYKAVRIQLINTDDSIEAGSINPQFIIDFSRVDFETWEPERPNDEISTQRILFKVLYDITNSDVINNCQLINGQVSY